MSNDKKIKLSTRKIVMLSMFLALSIALGIAESYIPYMWVPGVKIGFANIVILLVLYLYPKGYEALIIDILKVFVVSMLRGNIFDMGFVMSLSGALASFLIMYLSMRCFKKLTIFGVSVLGSFFHCLAQIFVAVGYLGSWNVFYYFPFMGLISIPMGLIIALVVSNILKIPYFSENLKKN